MNRFEDPKNIAIQEKIAARLKDWPNGRDALHDAVREAARANIYPGGAAPGMAEIQRLLEARSDTPRDVMDGWWHEERGVINEERERARARAVQRAWTEREYFEEDIQERIAACLKDWPENTDALRTAVREAARAEFYPAGLMPTEEEIQKRREGFNTRSGICSDWWHEERDKMALEQKQKQESEEPPKPLNSEDLEHRVEEEAKKPAMRPRM